MIHYDTRRRGIFLRLIQAVGSVFPAALLVALPCALLAAGLKVLTEQKEMEDAMKWLSAKDSVLRDSSAWNGYNVLVGFLVIFRTQQAYSRFWSGCTSTQTMRTEWYNSCSLLLASSSESTVEAEKIQDFEQTLLRLFCLLHASAWATLRRSDPHAHAAGWEILGRLNEECREAIRQTEAKAELIVHWIHRHVLSGIASGALPPALPYLSTSIGSLTRGFAAFQDAERIAEVPFPFPYVQACDWLLVIHWLVVPIVVCPWAANPWWTAAFAFLQVFILWSLQFTAMQLENPYGVDANDLDSDETHRRANRDWSLLTTETARLKPTAANTRHSLVTLLGAQNNHLSPRAPVAHTVGRDRKGTGEASPYAV